MLWVVSFVSFLLCLRFFLSFFVYKDNTSSTYTKSGKPRFQLSLKTIRSILPLSTLSMKRLIQEQARVQAEQLRVQQMQRQQEALRQQEVQRQQQQQQQQQKSQQEALQRQQQQQQQLQQHQDQQQQLQEQAQKHQQQEATEYKQQQQQLQAQQQQQQQQQRQKQSQQPSPSGNTGSQGGSIVSLLPGLGGLPLGSTDSNVVAGSPSATASPQQPSTQSANQNPQQQPPQPPSQNSSMGHVGTPTAASVSGYDATSSYLNALDESYLHCPTTTDSERQRAYTPRNPYPTPSSYPSTPSLVFENPNVFEKLGTDCLFLFFIMRRGRINST